MKQCKKCGEVKDLSAYYKHPKTKDKLSSKCKDCTKDDVRKNREARADYYKAYDAKRFKEDPRVKARHKRYKATEAGAASILATREKWLADNQNKRSAHVILGNSVRGGKVIKPKSCACCGSIPNRLHGHHEDYTQPINVVWCCPLCHKAIHKGEIKITVVDGKFTPA